MRTTILGLFLSLTTTAVCAQATFSVRGRVVDKTTGEGLPGTSVGLVGTSQGGISDGAGNFRIVNVAPGAYTLRASFIGYQNLEQKLTITNADASLTLRLAEDNTTLNEVQVVAQVAVERETPVAFSAVNEVKLKESLGGRDLPMILNETPGVYATQGRGGTGDSEISIRGFDQSNVAVLINGVPVNDMENGAVYWSNWDLGDVTRNMQVQRGLTASKLAVPSVGGTINVLTKGFEAKRGGRVRQEVGYNGYRKTSLMLSSGQLKGDWAVTVFGSRRVGNGWIDGLYDDAWTYFGSVSKRFGKHQLSLTGLGSPQKHGQRGPFGLTVSNYSAEKAQEFGDQSNQTPRGYRFNPDWNIVNRYKLNADGSRGADNYEQVNTQANFYHKPQVNLNHLWNASDKLFISNVVYASRGVGGGVIPAISSPKYDANGQVDLQYYYDRNVANRNLPTRTYYYRRADGSLADTSAFDPEARSLDFLYANRNEHKWVGFITSADYRLNDNVTLSAGVDGRYYRGAHYRSVYDLLGGDYIYDTNAPSGGSQVTPTTPASGTTNGDQFNSNFYRKLRVGDKYNNDFDGITKWLGGYAQVEYKKGPLAGFVSGTYSRVSYQRIDFFSAVPYTLPDGRTINIGNGLTAVGAESYTNSQTIRVPRSPADIQAIQSTGLTAGDTTLQVPYGTSLTYNNRTYRSVDVSGSTPRKTEVVRLPGFTAKTGFNYNLTEDNNVFFNIGYLSRVQYFNFIFNGQQRIKNVKNEGVFSMEVGYAISKPGFKAALNGYRTTWLNRSLTIQLPDQQFRTNVTGLSSVHQGVELDIAQEISRRVQLNAAFSIGDWRFRSNGVGREVNDAGVVVSETNVNVKGMHVGGAAQNQFMTGLRVEPVRGFYLRPTFTLFSKFYSNFRADLVSANEPQDTYRLPTQRNIDVHAGYSHEVRVGDHDYRVSLNGSLLNVLNEYYISYIPINTQSGAAAFDPSRMQVFFNQGRRATFGLAIDF